MVEVCTDFSGQIKENLLRSTFSDMKKPELLANHCVTSVINNNSNTGGGGGGNSGGMAGVAGGAAAATGGAPQACAGCGCGITDRFMLRAVNKLWHEDCLKCGACECRLGEVGSTLYEKANLILCRRDYLRLFGSTGYCAACSRLIPAFEMVMRARDRVYHLECFACQQCNHRFCVGDRFYLCDGRILCEYDYEERRVFGACLPQQQQQQLPPQQQQQQQLPQQQQQQASLEHIKRQVNSIQSECHISEPVGYRPAATPSISCSSNGTAAPTPTASAAAAVRSRRPQQQQLHHHHQQQQQQQQQQQRGRRRGYQRRSCAASGDARLNTGGAGVGAASVYSAVSSRGGGGAAAGGAGGGGDDASSSGYGSPDSFTMDTR